MLWLEWLHGRVFVVGSGWCLHVEDLGARVRVSALWSRGMVLGAWACGGGPLCVVLACWSAGWLGWNGTVGVTGVVACCQSIGGASGSCDSGGTT